MSEVAESTPAPVFPRTIDVADLAAACAALGMPAPSEGATTVDVELLPGRVASFVEAARSPTPFVYVCAASLTEARVHFEATFGVAQWGPDTVDPETLRLRGCLARTLETVIDVVHCPRAEDVGVPCGEDCSPSLSFE
jgi:hypothetical protein